MIRIWMERNTGTRLSAMSVTKNKMSTYKLKYPTELPEWFIYLNEKSLVSVLDVANLFGFKNVSSVHALFSQGSFPKPDCYFGGPKRGRGNVKHAKCQWKKSTLLAEIERRKQVSEELINQ